MVFGFCFCLSTIKEIFQYDRANIFTTVTYIIIISILSSSPRKLESLIFCTRKLPLLLLYEAHWTMQLTLQSTGNSL